MEKYGVEETVVVPPDCTQCPACGCTLRPVADTGVLVCPACGTKPFEEDQ